ncbi:MAG: MotA/TolQ/ExbB proton channel family protein [Pirellulaceae bacterium]
MNINFRSGRIALLAALLAVGLAGSLWLAHYAAAQDGESPSAAPPPVAADGAAQDDRAAAAPDVAESTGPRTTEGISLFKLFQSAGLLWLTPLAVMMVVVVTITIERALALRRSRVLPRELIMAIGQLGNSKSGFDPRQAYRMCQQYPSAASTVIRAMLLKVGRPHSEVEHAVAEASERAAERMYVNVRWLTLVAAVAPLFGLTGTVWGMIVAFHGTTMMGVNENRSQVLAEGIYTALVTTLGGLLIAIPAAIAAHWFEGRIQSLFHQIDELLFNLLPQIERYEGRVRFGRQGSEEEPSPPPVSNEQAEAEAEPVASTPK